MEYTDITLDTLGAALGREVKAEQVAQIMSHPASSLRVITIGLSNILKDSHAGITYKSFKTEAEGFAAKKLQIEKTLSELMAGTVRATRATAPKLSGYEAILAREARKALIVAIKDKQPTLDKDGIAALITEDRLAKVAANPKVIKIAQDLYAIEQSKVNDELDLDLDL